MKIYITGDSWVNGTGLANPAEDSWPAVLSKKLNAEFYNDSMLGGSNSHFLYRTIKNLNEDFDLYIIVWTATSKFTFYKSDNNYDAHFSAVLKHDLFENEDYYKIWGRTLFRVWHNRLYALKLWLQQIIQLQTMFDRYNKKYMMINAHENDLEKWLTPWPEFINATKKIINHNVMNDFQLLDEYKEIQFYVDQIDTSCFYGWNSFYLQQLKKTIAIDQVHPDKNGHQYIADLLYNSVQLKND